MSHPPNSPTFALPPFDHVKADVILRSSDGVDFRVFRLFLSLASPFFETLFDLPQPSEEANVDMEIQDGLPVIPVSEGGKTLDSLLRFCYPCTLAEDPVIEDFREIINVLDAAKKYSLDAIQPAVCKSLFTPKILRANSLRCFAIACRARLQEQCILAAKCTLREPLVPGWFKEIELVTSTELLSLLTYHRKCSDAVQTLKDDLSWIPAELKPRYGSSCECPDGEFKKSSGTPDWWKSFLFSTFLDLLDKPCAESIQSNIEKVKRTLRNEGTPWAVSPRGCKLCREVAPDRLRELTIVFANKLEEVTSKVKLSLKF
ncbi:hypothetical protein PISMIDRAFT_685310 [Pisolithus microcarpus 441]|uniref:BTB domain-containing protein n=1 Tax=Pisolithus microcarpus 441 TaxID=765257 RepID=A0A0C9ZBT4_9AGAM|nr:hypothetical protein BKA83DRAFT_685310 [Pisolithus microcarpus]KIK17398.1 hypothetical protein PISMIDRAFT_685310 [Pisolithus microcarpus 441]